MSIRQWAAAAALASAAFPVAAVDFNFYQLGRGAAFDFLPTDGVACTGGDQCSSNVNGGVLGGDLTFVAGSTATATASFATALGRRAGRAGNWTSRAAPGLGVYHAQTRATTTYLARR